GANGAPRFTADSPGPAQVAIASKDEGSYVQGRWVAGRRLNGDEAAQALPSDGIGMQRIRLIRFD
ncbi:MAG: DUF5597 domain-containing protein, partial [Bryobacterales bacterium]|nr:DUF5597 domain-containing protein [Bryobacterales bacterium]